MELQYLIHEPADIKSSTPLLILLHGYGSNEQDLFSFVPELPQDWLIVSFRAPLNSNYGGFAWYNIDFTDMQKLVDVPQAVESMKAITTGIMNITNHYGLTDNLTHIVGFSQGGILTYSIALPYPQLFSKVVCMSTYPEPKLLTNISKDKDALKKLDFFVSHGAEDAVIPLEWGRHAAELLDRFSIPFTFREYMSGHGVNQKNFLDLMEFLKQ